MNCPRCRTEMSSRTVVNPADAHFLLTTHVCGACTKRVLTLAPNPRYVAPPVEAPRESIASMRARQRREERRLVLRTLAIEGMRTNAGEEGGAL